MVQGASVMHVSLHHGREAEPPTTNTQQHLSTAAAAGWLVSASMSAAGRLTPC